MDRETLNAMSPEQIARLSADRHPTWPDGSAIRIGYCNTAVGVFDPVADRWVAHVERTIDGQWINTGGREFLVNGQRIERDWVEVSAA